MKHEKKLIELVIFAALAAWALSMIGCVTVTPVCRHIVLAQHAAAVDAGYEAETWLIKNPRPVHGFKFHAAVRIKKDGKWLWLDQPRTVWTASTNQPKGLLLNRIDNRIKPNKEAKTWLNHSE